MSSIDAGQHDGPAVDLGIDAGLAAKLGQPVEREVDLYGAAARLPALDGRDEVVGQVLALDVLAGTRSSGASS